ncbi:MAG: hypothetical protein ACFFDF_00895 [Candidatus Odinarchaeota archaeon]
MRKKQIFVILLVSILINIGITTIVFNGLGDTRPNLLPLDGKQAIDPTPEMIGEEEVELRRRAAIEGPEIATRASTIGEPATIGEELTITVGDFYTGADYDEKFIVLMDGEHGIILITKDAYDNYDAETDEYIFENPKWPIGGWTSEDRISTTQLTYLLDQFDNYIYPSVTTVFGEPLPRGDEGQKIWILILNIRDESYYDGTNTVFTVGYFSADESTNNNKNIIHIDTYNWAGYSGPGTNHVYEGVFAHEFEHLVHFDQDPDEDSWVDEGCADMAIYLSGYGHFTNHIINYLVFHPFTQLTVWGGTLADYGASYLFMLYLYEQFGGADFISALVQEQANSIEGIENTLTAFGYSESFDEIFDNWAIANYLDGDGKYGYECLDIGSAHTGGWSIEVAFEYYWGLPPFGTRDFYQLPIGFYSIFGPPQPYTVHYYRFGADSDMYIYFDGDDFAGVETIGDYSWHSGSGDWAYHHLHRTLEIPEDGATLNFWHWYNIEEDWDYGYVEVYDTNTQEWTTLEDLNGGTTTNLIRDQDNPNCPDDQEPTYYNETKNWNAFTGSSNGWQPVSMDLSPFKGHTIELYFRLWQDGAFSLLNWFVDEILIPELGIYDNAEADYGLWDTFGWYRSSGKWPVNWDVTYIKTIWQPEVPYPMEQTKHARKVLEEIPMYISPITQSGMITGIEECAAHARPALVAIVSNKANHVIGSDYQIYFGLM